MRYTRFVSLILTGITVVACAESEAPDDETNPARSSEISRIVPAEEALAGAHIPTLDPATMNGAEIAKVLGPRPHCEFRYTSSGKPVLALKPSSASGPAGGVLKLNGSLIQLNPLNTTASKTQNTIIMASGPVRAHLTPISPGQLEGRPSERRELNLVLEIDTRLRVGYRGYFNCLPAPATTSGQVKNGGR